jgi:hypothetical protein
MCWTISVPAPSGLGSRGISSASAFGPPVEQAMITARPAPVARRAATGASRRRSAGRRTRPLCAASATLRPSSLLNDAIDSPTAGLATRSNAPSASASTARAPCAGENAETTTTGTGSARPSRSARSTPMPSSPGIARSSVSASGRCSRHAASAASPSAAVATTSKPCRPSASASMRRMSRESSATTIRRLSPPPGIALRPRA